MSKSLVEKLSKIQAKLKAPKNQFNKFGNYAFRNCEDILEALKPLLAEAGIIVVITDEVVPVPTAGKVYVKATVHVSDGEDTIEVSAWAREADEQKGMSVAQITGSTSSYARKYALNGMFLIDDTKDADSTNTHGKEEEKPKRATNDSPATPDKKTEDKPAGRFAPKGKATEPAKQTPPPEDNGGWE
jgi:hypothetical protein